jgi:hypothetical protein
MPGICDQTQEDFHERVAEVEIFQPRGRRDHGETGFGPPDCDADPKTYPCHPPEWAIAFISLRNRKNTVKIKDLLNKGKCLIGLHEGEWKSVSPTECSFTRTCIRCGAEQQKVEHVWAEWVFVNEGSCDQTRTCGRCKIEEQRLVHAWGAATYKREESCEQVQTCARCRAVQAAPTKHVMNRWRYVGAEACTQIEQCSRCKADGIKQRVEHQWGDWQFHSETNQPVRVCVRCGELQVKSTPEAAAPRATPPGASPAGKSRKELFDALKPKMQQLAEMEGAMSRVLGAMADSAERTAHEATTTPTVSDDEVADLLARAGATEAPPAQSRMEHDPHLVGHWRHTNVMSSGGFSLVTDTHLVLDGEGRFARWSHSASGMGETTSARLEGTWQSREQTLVLTFDDGSESVLSYEVHARELLFPNGGSQKYWERVR